MRKICTDEEVEVWCCWWTQYLGVQGLRKWWEGHYRKGCIGQIDRCVFIPKLQLFASVLMIQIPPKNAGRWNIGFSSF